MATIKANADKKHLHKVTLCAMCPGYQTRSLIISDTETIEAWTKAHKPADSGAGVGRDARRCSL
ncbi:hypothetical protein C1Y08_14825 [Pseudomonas sp. FW306-02-F02-AA]|uniref:Uncharacterized protein n=1 Tax=Pseudomonas fluorescens TaxID=294 RepID=A0A0N9WX54_PSEFL|nr:hypothetical protein AO353_17270 [Pseudomonas fluorescens]PMZ00445.1 hypothetical protein C1Y07_30355 [Pseudomonas sp. FW306-02-F02-AB]PMZ06349.1 hypothetical protein C1Y06_30300 [Pseudomonas sp. FW306-02-H06C]PMZ15322.1 hypothetical protein C1Y08_14825 [Pseudomonas sp. FW306-02-F02-AA]PMZ22441.1 hypothetical protein C1Y09_07355 [Pseudomonas sp. FW306-02-F08-AA]PMZ27854.1 hypothetical protein C1Y05_11875 [Pseudomonas sp. FW306-02-F04-BA]PMZ30652.1 hypothetical protein C1X99_30355 [Pseudomo